MIPVDSNLTPFVNSGVESTSKHLMNKSAEP